MINATTQMMTYCRVTVVTEIIWSGKQWLVGICLKVNKYTTNKNLVGTEI